VKRHVRLIIIGLMLIVLLCVLSASKNQKQDARNSFSYISSNFSILWNTGTKDEFLQHGWWNGDVFYGYKLRNALSTLPANAYVAFRVKGNDRIHDDFPIDPSTISTVEVLDREGILIDLVSKYAVANTAEEKEQIFYDISCYLMELTSGVDAYKDADVAVYGWYRDLRTEQESIVGEYINEIYHERHIYLPDSETRALIYQEAEERALQKSERYRELANMCAYYDHLAAHKDTFWKEWNVQTAKTTRDRFVRWGFLPVYSEEEAGSSRELLLTFVGTAAQIKSLDCLVEDTESFIVVMANAPLLEKTNAIWFEDEAY